MNIMKMMKQAAGLQQKMQEKQAQLAERSVEFSSGGGMVTAVARGDLTIERVRIDPKVVDPSDVEMLEDLVTAAVDGALKAARELVEREMSSLTQGIGLPPGTKLPFM
jgi:nucleoid-associated protein EbfC